MEKQGLVFKRRYLFLLENLFIALSEIKNTEVEMTFEKAISILTEKVLHRLDRTQRKRLQGPLDALITDSKCVDVLGKASSQ